ncbi:T9SS type A sorting domain-containing protein [Flavobacterium sp. CYK-4]|uniref:T9SS type A sorting domain-containing protein n=1 Tax=Flavobacterium lotistagni TaxID=2709660 RepID=UPI0014093438|nr:T9SS type A sorting domain-containing protein [Flavobacterium lotistagni]NHM06947.1 T9SS type A sorting domain-containing protein [Flavobacterium lotistagni]
MKHPILFSLFLVISQFSFAQYGDLDPTFHGTGQNGSLFEGDSRARSIIFQENGKVIFAGNADYATTLGDKLVGLIRVNEDGNFDTTFGTDGVIRMRVKNASFTNFGSLLKIDDSSYYLVSYYGERYSLTKLNLDCVVDTSFGTNGTFDLVYGTIFNAANVKVAPDGSFTASGKAKQTSSGPIGLALGKYFSNATVDTSFGNNGFLFFPLNDIPASSADNISGSLYPLSDGKYLVLGNYVYTDAGNVQRRNYFIKKFNADATVDNSYGTSGVMLSNAISSAYLTKVADDGSVSLLANPVTTYLNSPPTSIRTIKFDASGNLVAEPVIYYGSTLPNTYIFSVLEQEDGKIVFAGQYMDNPPLTGTDSFVIRCLPNGNYDSTFGNNGIFKAAFGGNENISRIAFDSQGRLVFAGTRIFNGHWEYLMGRLTTGIVLGNLDFNTGASLTVYPNPVQSATVLHYELAQEQKISIGLYDLTGRLVRKFATDATRNQGAHQETLDFQSLGKGTYLLQLSSAEQISSTVKIIRQ